jgi:hypothetical protein
MLICIKLCTHIGQIDCEDTTDAAVESVHSGEFPLHYNVDSFCASEIVTYQNTCFTMVIIDKPTGHQRSVIE